MMAFAYDRHLPSGMKWRDLFDMVRTAVPGGGGVLTPAVRFLAGAAHVCEMERLWAWWWDVVE
jgi:hypothetical protein